MLKQLVRLDVCLLKHKTRNEAIEIISKKYKITVKTAKKLITESKILFKDDKMRGKGETTAGYNRRIQDSKKSRTGAMQILEELERGDKVTITRETRSKDGVVCEKYKDKIIIKYENISGRKCMVTKADIICKSVVVRRRL